MVVGGLAMQRCQTGVCDGTEERSDEGLNREGYLIL